MHEVNNISMTEHEQECKLNYKYTE